MRNRVMIIAEAGVNHNGSIAIAKRLIDSAKKAGADAVKFQTFKAEKVTTKNAGKADYQIRNTGTRGKQFKMLEALELSGEAFRKLYMYCRIKDIEFMSSPFDLESVDLLDDLGMKQFKISSGEITNKPLIQHVAAKKKPILLSTGMSSLGEVAMAVGWIRQVWRGCHEKPELTLLHCVSSYPADAGDVNLLAMKTMETEFKLPAGYSDHTMGIEISLAAVALGAKVIEKHFTIDRDMSGPDHKASLEPDELGMMVKAIRNIEKSMGDGVKKLSASEQNNVLLARRSIVASRDIRNGEKFCDENIAAKRPSGGISPMDWEKVIGRTAKKAFYKDSFIEL
jgi:N,N'-diacetyllegionaminate synthase